MQVFRAFFKSSKKFLPMNIMYFIIFCVIAIMAANYNSDTENSVFQAASLEIGIIDNDNSQTSKALSNYLGALHTLTPLDYDREVLLDGLFYRTLDYILILPEGFEARLLSGEENDLFETVQIPGIFSSTFAEEQINSYIKTLMIYLAGDIPLDEAISQTQSSLSAASGQVDILEFENGEETSSDLTCIYFFYQFLAYVLLSMILTGLTPILVIFWDRDLARRMSCSSLNLLGRNLQLALGSILYCLGIWLLFVLTSRIFYGAEMFSEQGLLRIANSFLLLPVSISIALILGCFAPTGNMISAINNIITLGMSFLCGIFVPQQQLGENILAFSKYLPLYWYIKNNDLISDFTKESFQMRAYWRNWGIQLFYAAAIFSVALAVSKYKSARQKS